MGSEMCIRDREMTHGNVRRSDNVPPRSPHYASAADAINARSGCSAVHTSKRELENYLHPGAITLEYPQVVLSEIADFDDVPMLVAQQIHVSSDSRQPWTDLSAEKRKKKESQAKSWLNKQAVSRMTPEMFAQSDPKGEIGEWLKQISHIATS